MTRVLYVAAGGGGDAIAAWALRLSTAPESPPLIATFAWDRIMVDPLPGPRAASDFGDLVLVDDLNWAFSAATRPIYPAGSTLPRLAASIAATLVLLEPVGGAVGLRRQLRSLALTKSVERIVIVDVGGDILGAGDEPTLRSPLADALVLAAGDQQDLPVEVHVVGAGLDGELPATTVHEYERALGGRQVDRLSEQRAQDIMPILEWHPSEATALTAAAALGLRGKVEIRQDGHIVEMTERSPDVCAIAHDRALDHSRPAQAVHDSRSLDEAEDAVRAVCGRSELDQERSKAAARRTAPATHFVSQAVTAARAYCLEAHNRGVDYVTFRRLAEVTSLSGARAQNLRHWLIADEPERYRPPLWSTDGPVLSPVLTRPIPLA